MGFLVVVFFLGRGEIMPKAGARQAWDSNSHYGPGRAAGWGHTAYNRAVLCGGRPCDLTGRVFRQALSPAARAASGLRNSATEVFHMARSSKAGYLASSTSTQSLPTAGVPGGVKSRSPCALNESNTRYSPVRGSNHEAFTCLPESLSSRTRKGLPVGA